jgi:uncharacterized protein
MEERAVGEWVPVRQGVPHSWNDALAAGSFYSSADWLRFCDSDAPGAVGTVAAALPSGGRAAVPLVEQGENSMRYYRWHDLLTQAGLPAPRPRGLLVGPSRGYQTDLLRTVDADPAEAAAAVLAGVRAIARDRGMPCVAMYLTTQDMLLLRAAGVRSPAVLLEADAWIAVPADGWDGWMAGLSRHRRTQIRRDERAFVAAGYRIERHTLPEVCDRLGALWAPTQERYYGRPFDPAQLTGQMRVQAAAMGDQAEVLLCLEPDGSPVGFCVSYRWGDRVHLRTTGFDYARLRGAAEYFNLSYYHHLHQARQTGLRHIHAGIKSIGAKSLRGARIRPLWLLDLTEDSVLTGQDDAVAAHNRARFDALLAEGPSVAAAVDTEAWRPLLAERPAAERTITQA